VTCSSATKYASGGGKAGVHFGNPFLRRKCVWLGFVSSDVPNRPKKKQIKPERAITTIDAASNRSGLHLLFGASRSVLHVRRP